MILTIAKKELSDNLMTFRFAIGTLTIILLIPVFTWLGIRDYNRRVETYQAQVESSQKSLERVRCYIDLANFNLLVVEPPQPLSVLGRGVSGQIDNRMNVQLLRIPTLFFQNLSRGERRGFLRVFLSVDPLWVFLIIISLLALLLAYDSVSAEKEDRTLAMVLSSSSSRTGFFLGKYLGLVACLTIPLVLGFILSLLMLFIKAPGLLTASDLTRMVLAFVTLWIYGSIFLTIGLVVSSVTHNSSTSLVSLLFVWVLLIVLIPLGSIYLAKSIKPLPFRYVIERNYKRFNEEVEARPEFAPPSFSWSPITDHTGQISWRPTQAYIGIYGMLPGEWVADLGRTYRSRIPDFLSLAGEHYNIFYPYCEGGMVPQVELSRWFERISPMGSTRHLVEALFATDHASFLRFLGATRRYRESIISYLENKLDVDPHLFITGFSENKLPDEATYLSQLTGGKYRSVDAIIKAMQTSGGGQADPKEILINRPSYNQRPEKLTLDDLPVFNHSREPLVSTINRTVVDLCSLLFGQTLLFVLGMVLILRYDPR